MRRFAVFALALAVTTSALADGSYSGASSVAGGRGAACAGVTPMDAYVSGSSIQLTGYAYEGSGDRASGTVKSDGSFTATMAAPSGTVTFSGHVTAHSVTAQWKGSDCWGAIDLTK